MALDGDRSVKGLVVSGTGLFAIPGLAAVFQSRFLSIFAGEQLAGEFPPTEREQLLHHLFARVEVALLNLFPVHVGNGNSQLLCLPIGIDGNFHLRPSGWFVVAATNR